MEVNLEGIEGPLVTFLVDVNLDQFTPGLEYAWISICQLSMDRGEPGKLGQGIGYLWWNCWWTSRQCDSHHQCHLCVKPLEGAQMSRYKLTIQLDYTTGQHYRLAGWLYGLTGLLDTGWTWQYRLTIHTSSPACQTLGGSAIHCIGNTDCPLITLLSWWCAVHSLFWPPCDARTVNVWVRNLWVNHNWQNWPLVSARV